MFSFFYHYKDYKGLRVSYKKQKLLTSLGYMTKTLNHIFLFLHQNQNIFFSNIGNQNIFFQKKTITPPLEVKWSVPKCGLKKTELCTFCTENKEILVHIFRECNYVWNFWLSIGNFLKICGLSLPFNAKDIILGLTEHSSAQGIINNVLIILKYYIYVCRCKCRDPDLEGGLEFLKYAINIEKASMIYLSPVQKEHAKRKWLDLEAVLSG